MNKFMKRNAQPLKIVALLVGFAGTLIASELQRRETRELVEEVIAEREAEKARSDSDE